MEILIQGERDVTVTVKGLELEPSYIINKADVQRNQGEYSCSVRMFSGTRRLDIMKVSWAFYPGEEETVRLADIPNFLYIRDGNDMAQFVESLDPQAMEIVRPPIRCEIGEDSLIWHFTLPETCLDTKFYEDAVLVNGKYDLTDLALDNYILPQNFDMTAIEKVEIHCQDHIEYSVLESYDLTQSTN